MCVTVWVHFWSISGPFWVHLWSKNRHLDKSAFRQKSVFRQECSLNKNSENKRAKRAPLDSTNAFGDTHTNAFGEGQWLTHIQTHLGLDTHVNEVNGPQRPLLMTFLQCSPTKKKKELHPSNVWWRAFSERQGRGFVFNASRSWLKTSPALVELSLLWMSPCGPLCAAQESHTQTPLTSTGQLQHARGDETTHPELVRSGRCRVVLAMETEGRWGEETVNVIHQLAIAKSWEVRSHMNNQIALTWEKRWTRMFATTCAISFAALLVEPSLRPVGWLMRWVAFRTDLIVH